MRWDLVRFDLMESLPIAFRILRRELGTFGTLRFLFSFVARSTFTDPFRALRGDPKPGRGEAYTRQLLRSALLFDATLRSHRKINGEKVHQILLEIVGQSGAAYIRANLHTPTADEWHAMSTHEQHGFATGVLDRFENTEANIVATPDHDFGFDVHFCHFADLCRRLDRMDLAPLFCAADSLYFGDPLVPIRLDRAEIISKGDARCAFRFQIEESP